MTYEDSDCFIRNVGIDNHDSNCMAISHLITQIKNNVYGSNIKIIEPYIIDNEIPQVLRTVATYSKSEGLVIVKHDDVFENFIKTLGMKMPESKCLEYLNKLSF